MLTMPVQRTGASWHAEWLCGRPGWLAPAADLPRSPPNHIMSNSPGIIIKDGPEALQWLRSNGHEAPLASNRFSSTAEAIAFVEQLYSAGARRVFVPADTIIDDEEERELGGAYSDSLVVELSSSSVPDALLSLYCEEATLEGCDLRHEPPPVIDGRYLFLWWD